MIEWPSAAGVSIGVDLGDRQGGIKARLEVSPFELCERLRDVEGDCEACEGLGVSRWRD